MNVMKLNVNICFEMDMSVTGLRSDLKYFYFNQPLYFILFLLLIEMEFYCY